MVRRMSAGSVWRYSFHGDQMRDHPVEKAAPDVPVGLGRSDQTILFGAPPVAGRDHEGLARSLLPVPHVEDAVALEPVDALQNLRLAQPLGDLEGDLVPAGCVQGPEREIDGALRRVGGRFEVEAERGQECRTDAVGFVHSLFVSGARAMSDRYPGNNYIMPKAGFRLILGPSRGNFET